MPTLNIEITCLKTRCGGCYHCHYGGKRTIIPDITCTLFGRALHSPDVRITRIWEMDRPNKARTDKFCKRCARLKEGAKVAEAMMGNQEAS